MCQAELPACHRTAEVLRGEHHIRRCESSSLPAAIHAVNLMINHPRSPPTGTLQFPICLWRTSLKHLYIKSSSSRTILIAPVFYLVLCQFTFCAGEGPVYCWRQRNARPRDSDVVHILVRKCGSRRRSRSADCLPRQVLSDLTAVFPEYPCGFGNEFVGSSKFCLKMAALESILWRMGC